MVEARMKLLSAMVLGPILGVAACEAYSQQAPLLPASTAASPPPSGYSAAPPPSASVTVPVRVSADPNEIHTSTPILFETGGASLRLDSAAALKQVAESLKSAPEVTLVRIESHMDDPGGGAAAMSLSQRRAMSVAKKLIGYGVECERLLPVGFGSAEHEKGLVLVKAAVRGKPVAGPVAGGGTVAGDPCR